MKLLYTLLLLTAVNYTATCQVSMSIPLAATDSPKHVVLSEVAVSAKKSESGEYKKKVRSFNSHYIIQPNKLKGGLEHYLGTYCAPLNSLPIKLYTIELKLAPYDPALFTTKLIVAQVQSSGDTMFKTFEVNAAEINKKKLVLNVKEENIILEPGNYYMGYSFIPMNLDEPYRYRIYQNDNGVGASINLTGDNIKIYHSDNFGYNFPFRISYITL